MVKHFYIFSTGRCGTTFLSRLIQQNDPTLSNVHQQKDSKRLNMQANLAISNRWYKKRFIASLSRKYTHALPPSTADPLRSVAYLLYLEKLFEDYPGLRDDAIIIHLVRDPRDFVSSFMNWKNRKLSGKIAHHLVPFWMPEPKLKERLSMSKFEHFCWIWNKKNRLFADAFSHLPNYHLFRIEDLKPDSEKLQELLHLTTNSDDVKTVLNKTSHNRSMNDGFPSWEIWEPGRAKKFDKICGNLMKKYEYGHEEKWVALLKA